MIRSPQHESAEALSTASQPTFGRDIAQDRQSAVLVPFPAPGARRPRRGPRSDENRGELLFFLGVRYERLAS